jgi:D-glucuronyl C5-epimerase C-terminus
LPTTESSDPGQRSPHLTRRTVLGACAAAGAVPFIAAEPAGARDPVRPAPVAPKVIDPAFEISPPGPIEAPWARHRLPDGEAWPLAPRQRSAPGDGEFSAPTQTYAASAIPFQFVYHSFPVRELPVEVSPYYRSTPVPLVDTGYHDSQGVRMFYRDGKLYDHPVAQAQYGLALLESYRLTGNQTYLDRAGQQAQRLQDRRVVRSNAWFYPYPFSIQLHGTYDVYNPPWYSMMAQGQALSLFTRLHTVTGATAWSTAADATFASFLLPPVAGQPWGVWVVDNHLWLEEYPHPKLIKGDRTYNGHTFSAYGLYDYWVHTKNADAELLLQGAMTTTRDVAAAIRTVNWRSKYCLAHNVDSGHYHTLHMEQHTQLYAITGDSSFAQIADPFYDDFPPNLVRGTIRFAAGRHTGCKFNSSGVVTATKLLELAAGSSAPSTERQKVWHQPGVWYSISAGGLAGYQVQETTPYRYQLGQYAGLGYLLHRPGTIKTATPKAYTVSSAGAMTSVVTTYQIGDPITIDIRAVLNGVQHVRLADGPYAGRWLGLAAVARG